MRESDEYRDHFFSFFEGIIHHHLPDVDVTLANRMRDIFCDGWPRVKVTCIWMAVDVQSSSGFITLANIGEDWFNVLRSTASYDPLSGWTDAFFCTWPLTDSYLREPDTLLETMLNAR